MDNEISSILQELGFNDKEMQIYVILLQVGTAPASTLGVRANMQRSTAQYTCQQLTKKGIIRMIQRGRTYMYTAESPEKLLLLLNEERTKIDEKEKRVKGIVGELKDLMSPESDLPTIKYFQGENEMIQLYEEILNKKQPIDSIEESGELFNLFPNYPHEFAEKRIANKTPNRCIAPPGNKLNISNPDRFIDVRYVDTSAYPFTWHIKICDDIVCIFSFEKKAPVAISIQHEDIVQNFKYLFDFMWNTLASTQ